MTPLNIYQLCLAISCRVLRGLTKLNGHEQKSWKLPDTLKSSVIFETQIWVIYEKSYLFFPSSQEPVLSRHDYTVYTAITHLRNIYLVSKMPSPIFLSIGYTKNAITDDDSHYMFIDDI